MDSGGDKAATDWYAHFTTNLQDRAIKMLL